MQQQFTYVFLISLTALVLILFWAGSIAIVYWDTHRRGLGGLESLGWLALSVLLPVVGFLAYWVARLIAYFVLPAGAPGGEGKRRITQPLILPETENVHMTIPAVDLVKGTIPAPLVTPDLPPATAPQASMALSVVDGPCLGKRFSLVNLPARIGRGEQVSIRLDQDLGISRQHAELYSQGGVLRIRDLHSLHGTHVNGFTIEDKGLDVGDRIRVGSSVLEVQRSKG